MDEKKVMVSPKALKWCLEEMDRLEARAKTAEGQLFRVDSMIALLDARRGSGALEMMHRPELEEIHRSLATV